MPTGLRQKTTSQGAGSWGWTVPQGGAHPQTQQEPEGPRGQAVASHLLSVATGVTPLPSPIKGTKLEANAHRAKKR